MHRCIPLLLALATLRLATAGETPTPPKAEAPSVFDTPLLVARQMAVSLQFIQLARAKRFAEAEALLVKAVAIPNFDTAVNHYNLACLHALQGKGDAALADLAAAVERGYTDAKHMREDADLKSLHALPRFEAIAKDAEAKTAATPRRRPVLKRVKDGVATVDEANVFWSARAKQFIVLHSFPDAEPATPITTMKGPAGDLLREWKKDGAAAGLHGVLYDNRDRGHSTMNTRQFPQIARVEYCEAARKRGFDNGLQRMFLHNAPTLGNSSTALTRGAAWGSQTRSALRRTQLIDVLARQYVNNHLYFYPEHRDHDVDSHGDVFHMNVPYVITSQGSSGSDRAFMDAAACILAAFRPDTRSALAEKKLLMPTVQMVFRMNRTVIANPSDYLTGKAHPMAFDAKTLNLERMVRAAHAITPRTIPPLVRLRVVEEDDATVGVDYFDVRTAEQLSNSVCAIARVARASRWERRMVVSVADTRDPNDRPLTFQWRLLRGDPERVHITPLDKQGAKAEIRVAWHERRPVEPGSALLSSRVDIGIFANNGTHTSAPSFISWYFPPHEKRVYDAAHRIQSIDYRPANSKDHYTDPALVTPALWRDAYRYDAKGRLLGWTRSRGAKTEEFTRHGALVARKDAKGRPLEARTVRYVRKQKSLTDWPVLNQEPGAEVLTYSYESDDDLLGTQSRRKVGAK